MLFKDQAMALVARWESLHDEDQLETLALQTVVALTKVENVPTYIFDALDHLLDWEHERVGRSTFEVVQYLRSLAEETRTTGVVRA